MKWIALTFGLGIYTMFYIVGIPFSMGINDIKYRNNRFVYTTSSKTVASLIKHSSDIQYICDNKKYCLNKTSRKISVDVPIKMELCHAENIINNFECSRSKAVVSLTTKDWVKSSFMKGM